MAFDVFRIVFLGDVFGNVGVTFWHHFKLSWPPKYTLFGHAGTSPYRKARWLFKCKQRAIWIQKRLGLHFGTFFHLLVEVFGTASALFVRSF